MLQSCQLLIKALILAAGLMWLAAPAKAAPCGSFALNGITGQLNCVGILQSTTTNPNGNPCSFSSPVLYYNGVQYTCANNTTYASASGGGGGTGAAAVIVTVAFSATPTFNAQSASAGTVVDFQGSGNAAIGLTGNITSSTITNVTPGSILNFLFQQDATGGRTVAMPSGFDPPVVHPAPNATTKISYYYDGAHGRLLNATSDTGYSACSETSQPGSSPPSGTEFSWCDSTRKTVGVTNSSGVVHIAPKTSCLTDQLCAQDTSGVEFCTGAGTANAQTATCTPANQSLITGLTVRWSPTNANTAATTLGIDSLTVKNLTKCGTTALASGDLAVGVIAIATYDGTEWQLLNAQSSGGGCGAGGAGGTMFTTHGTGWYSPFGSVGAVNSVNAIANQLRVVQISIPTQMTVGRVSFVINTAIAASNIGVAIYNSACNSLLASSSSGVSTASTGSVYPTLSSALSMSPGTYNVAYSFDTNNVVWNVIGLPLAQAMSEPSFARYNTAANTVTWAAGAPTFPATCGALTGVSVGTDFSPFFVMMP